MMSRKNQREAIILYFLFKMQEPVEFSNKIAPACLPTADNDYGNKYKKSFYSTKFICTKNVSTYSTLSILFRCCTLKSPRYANPAIQNLRAPAVGWSRKWLFLLCVILKWP